MNYEFPRGEDWPLFDEDDFELGIEQAINWAMFCITAILEHAEWQVSVCFSMMNESMNGLRDWFPPGTMTNLGQDIGLFLELTAASMEDILANTMDSVENFLREFYDYFFPFADIVWRQVAQRVEDFIISSFLWPYFWMKQWFVELFEAWQEWAAETACNWAPEELWRRGYIPWAQCLRRLHPWEYWWTQHGGQTIELMSIAAAVVCVCLAATYALYEIYTFREKALVSSRWRSARLLVNWILGTELEHSGFRPLELSGERGGVQWCSNGQGIRVQRSGEENLFEYLPVCNGTYWCGWTPYLIRTVRDNDIVTWKMIPTWWANNNLPWDLQAGDYVMRKEVDPDCGLIKCYLTEKGSHTCAVIPVAVWDTIMNALKSAEKSTQPFTPGTIVSRMVNKIPDAELTIIQSAVATFWNHTLATVQPGLQKSRPAQILQFVGDMRDRVDAIYKLAGRKIMCCFCANPDAMPTTGRQSDICAVHYRLDGKRNPVWDQFPVELKGYCAEFVHHVTKAGTVRLVPWSLQQMLDHQDGPLQKKRNAEAQWVMNAKWTDLKVKAMTKKEAIADMAATRCISTVSAEFNLELGTYLMSAAAYLKKETKWYCAGKTPREIGERIVTIAARAETMPNGVKRLSCADVSKMDAAKHPYLTAWLTTAIYVSLFGEREESLIDLRCKEASSRAKTATQDPYSVGASQLSGSACTTIDNTITNAFISYVSDRLDGFSPDDSYDRLGAYVGDDSVSLNRPTGLLHAGRLLGYNLTSEDVYYGGGQVDPIPFLSRYFYNAWHGGPESLQDPVRLMRKIHISISPDTITEQQAAVNKARGYAELDPHCSVYLALHHALEKVTGCQADDRRYDDTYMQKWAREEGGWPSDDQADNYWAMKTGLDPSRLTSWLLQLKNFEEFLAGPPALIENTAQVKIPLTVDPTNVAAAPPTGLAQVAPPPTATVCMPPTAPACVEASDRAKLAVKEIGKVASNARRTARQSDATLAKRPRKGQFPVGTWKPTPAPTTYWRSSAASI